MITSRLWRRWPPSALAHRSSLSSPGGSLVSRRVLGVIGSAATVALLAAAMQSPAQAAEPTDQADSATAPRLDDRPDPVAAEQRELNQKAVELVLTGDREVKSRGGSTAVKVAPGQWAQYGLQSSDNIFTILVEFGDQKDPRFPTAPAGPQHNQIPQPDRAVDNTHVLDRRLQPRALPGHVLRRRGRVDEEPLRGAVQRPLHRRAATSATGSRSRTTRPATARPRARPT